MGDAVVSERLSVKPIRFWRVGGGTGGPRPVALDHWSRVGAENVNTLSFDHVCDGEGRLLVVGISWFESTLSIETDFHISGITFDGVPLTFKSSIIALRQNELWYLVAPHKGTFTITVTFGGLAVGLGSLATLVASAVSFREVNQAIPLGNEVQATGTSTTPLVNINTLSSRNIVLDHLAVDQSAGFATRSVGALQILTTNAQVGAIAANRTSGSTSIEPADGAAITMSWTLSASRNWTTQALEVLAA